MILETLYLIYHNLKVKEKHISKLINTLSKTSLG